MYFAWRTFNFTIMINSKYSLDYRLQYPINNNKLFDWGTVISAAGSIGSALLNSKSQSDTNASNANLNEENRTWQEKMWQKTADYNTDMWNATNKYNSAVSQRARLEQAGLNPYLMMNGGSSGTATSSSVSTPSTPSTIAKQAVNYDGLMQAATNIGNQLIEHRKGQAEVDNLRSQTQYNNIRNAYAASQFESGIELMKKQASSLETKRQLDEQEKKLRISTFNSDVEQKQLQNVLLGQEIELRTKQVTNEEFQNQILKTNLKYLPQQLQANLNSTLAGIAVQYSQASLNRASAHKAMCEAIESTARTEGIRISNKVAAQTADSLIERVSIENDKLSWDTEHSKNNSGSDNPFKLNNSPGYKNGVGSGLVNMLYGISDIIK